MKSQLLSESMFNYGYKKAADGLSVFEVHLLFFNSIIKPLIASFEPLY
jgi:hypothetical protein